MKRAFYLLAAVAALMTGFMSCSNNDDDDLGSADQNLELRAMTLGYSDTLSYQASVAAQCAAGNHENCDIQADGTHKACSYIEHSGTKHDGTHHNGSDHGTHNANGHSHNSHGTEQHHTR